MPPKNREPVSPIKTLAGCQFHSRKPTHPAAAARPRAVRPVMDKAPAHRDRARNTKKDTVELRPSMPSVKFTAFTRPTSTMAARM